MLFYSPNAVKGVLSSNDATFQHEGNGVFKLRKAHDMTEPEGSQ